MSQVNETSDQELKAIIVDGDTEKLVKRAKVLGQQLKRANLSTAQIRNVFTTVRQIEMNWPIRTQPGQDASSAVRQLRLLEPKLAYQSSRQQPGSRGMEILATELGAAIRLVGKDRKHFQNLVDFFEAILAYHTANLDLKGNQHA